MQEEFYDSIEFESDEEMIDYLRNKTENFDIIDFYNQGHDVSGLIVITPEQMIEVHPVTYHQFATDSIYNLLYGYKYNEEMKNVTNNILIRLVCGSSFQFYSIVPDTITPFQKECFQKLIDSLKNYHEDINFDDGEGFAEALFEETLKDSRNKATHVMVGDCGKKLFRDKYIISKAKKNTSF